MIEKDHPRFLGPRVSSLKTEIKAIYTGDFVFEEDGICIERKEQEDFAGSILSGRLKEQAIRMSEYPNSFIIISGKFETNVIRANKCKISWTYDKYLGARISLLTKFPLKIIEVPDDFILIDTIFRIKEKFDKFKKNGVGFVADIKKKSDIINPNYALYMTIPGIGHKKATEIIDKYPKFSYFYNKFYTSNLDIKLRKISLDFLRLTLNGD